MAAGFEARFPELWALAKQDRWDECDRQDCLSRDRPQHLLTWQSVLLDVSDRFFDGGWLALELCFESLEEGEY